MKIVSFDGMEIEGLSVRTTNEIEFNSDTPKIANLYQAFDEKVSVDYKKGYRAYGVYFDYESDASGEFSVLAGSNQMSEPVNPHLEKVSLQQGRYMIFNGKGKMPEVVINTWSEVWDYFEREAVDYKRAFTTDFEYYKSENEVDIYIAIK